MHGECVCGVCYVCECGVLWCVVSVYESVYVYVVCMSMVCVCGV